MFTRILLVVLAVLVVGSGASYLWTRVSPHEPRTEIEIDAPVDEVWAVLTDLDAYADWNPFIVSAAGEIEVGARLTNTLKDDGSSTVFTPEVLVADEAKELRWIGRFWVPGIVDGEHYFELEAIDGGRTRLVQGETFTGVLVPFAGSALDVEDDFAAMNEALKARVEAGSATRAESGAAAAVEARS